MILFDTHVYMYISNDCERSLISKFGSLGEALFV